MPRTLRQIGALALFVVFTGCAEPPHKEMNQAQGAIDAARAAGADQYATTELAAATDALKRSEEAVAQNDYRLALSFAIDARERAQTAAKVAVDTRAKARGNAERIVAEANSSLTQARARFDDATLAKLPRRAARDVRDLLTGGEQSMQEARTALERDEYERAINVANALAARITDTLRLVDKSASPPPVRKRR